MLIMAILFISGNVMISGCSVIIKLGLIKVAALEVKSLHYDVVTWARAKIKSHYTSAQWAGGMEPVFIAGTLSGEIMMKNLIFACYKCKIVELLILITIL